MGDPAPISTKELEALTGVNIGTKVEYVAYGERAWRRVADGWIEYPEYPR